MHLRLLVDCKSSLSWPEWSWRGCCQSDSLRSIIRHAEECSTSTNPIVSMLLRWQVHEQHEVSRVSSSTQLSRSKTGLVEWALVSSLQVEIYWQERLKPDHREVNEWNLWIGVFDDLFGVVPFRSLEEHSIDVNSNFRCLCNIILHDALDVGLEGKRVNGRHSCSRIRLKRGSHETLWEEEGR